ncbi:hypothetical protein LCGC14_2089780 [marine sediment metagenome]|uniref:Uncharacterized protein n=1 Tax=marine sediment metagenome TaxID=412755 RepID=A0A0F9GR93_9ZZZZ
MSNDNRNIILSHQAIDDANDSSYRQQQMEQHRMMIGLLDANVKRLKTELADMTAQRDAWRTTAIALEQKPGRLKTVASTAEQKRIVILDVLRVSGGYVTGSDWDASHRNILTHLKNELHYVDIDYEQTPSIWHITPAGRAALAAHNARNESEADAT